MIGTGKYSQVFLVKKENQEFAVKQLKREPNTASQLDNIHNEVVILSQIQHAHVLQMIDRFRTKDHYYLITEHCSGGDLRNFQKAKGFLGESLV